VNNTGTQERSHEHQYVWSQIPWYVNDTISERERERIDAHIGACPACVVELQQQSAVHRAMTGDSGVRHLSSGSLNRLRQRLDALPESETAAHPRRAVTPARALLAASAAVIAVATAWVTISSRNGSPALYADNYRTVTSSEKRAPGVVVRAVFAPQVTLAQLQTLLDDAHLKIIAGPTEAGVYSLASTQTQPVGESLKRLRQNPAVRFAEATGP